MKNFDNASNELDRKELISLDEKFHHIIYQSSGNKKLNEIVRELQDQFQRFRLSYFNELSSYMKLANSHNKLYQAIIDGDEKAAEEYAKEHIEEIRDNIISWKSNNE
jgi:DNA-binding GntR family transcriptional regulator